MSKTLSLAAAAVICPLASGCINAVTTIRVKPDGSGTIEQTVAMKAEAAEQFAQMAAGFGGGAKAGAKAAPPELFSEQEMKDAATKYGEGVTFVSSKPIKTAEYVGRVATYSFTDITKVRISEKPPTPKGGMDTPGPKAAPEDVSFKFAKGAAGDSVVTVVFPEPDLAKKKADGTAKPKAPAEKPDPQQIAMMKKMFDGMHIEIGLEVAGTIVKTNSPYVQGSRVTLLEMDFTQLMNNDALLSQMGEPDSVEDAKKLLKDVKGFKINLDKEVSVEFK